MSKQKSKRVEFSYVIDVSDAFVEMCGGVDEECTQPGKKVEKSENGPRRHRVPEQTRCCTRSHGVDIEEEKEENSCHRRFRPSWFVLRVDFSQKLYGYESNNHRTRRTDSREEDKPSALCFIGESYRQRRIYATEKAVPGRGAMESSRLGIGRNGGAS